MKKLLIPFSLFFLINIQLFPNQIPSIDSTQSDEKVILFYMSGNQYLRPVILNALKDLKHFNAEKKYFNKVIGLNEAVDIEKLNEVRQTTHDYFRGVKYSESEEAIESSSQYAKVYGKFDYLLDTKTYIINDLVEFQFILYKYNSPSIEYKNPLVNPLNLTEIESKSVILNLNSGDYSKKLRYAILSFFKHLSSPPEIKVKINDKIISCYDTIRIGLNDTTIIDLQNTYDKDTPYEDIEFSFFQIGLNKHNPIIEERLNLKPNNDYQKVIPKKMEYYNIIVCAYDQVNYTYDTIRLYAELKPKFRFFSQNTTTIFRSSLIYGRRGGFYEINSNRYQKKYGCDNFPFILETNLEKFELQVFDEDYSDFINEREFNLSDTTSKGCFCLGELPYKYDNSTDYKIRFSYGNRYSEVFNIQITEKSFLPIGIYTSIGAQYFNNYILSDEFAQINKWFYYANIGLTTHFTKWVIFNLGASIPANLYNYSYVEKNNIIFFDFKAINYLNTSITIQSPGFLKSKLKFGLDLGLSLYYFEFRDIESSNLGIEISNSNKDQNTNFKTNKLIVFGSFIMKYSLIKNSILFSKIGSTNMLNNDNKIIKIDMGIIFIIQGKPRSQLWGRF